MAYAYTVEELEAAAQHPSDPYYRELMRWAVEQIRHQTAPLVATPEAPRKVMEYRAVVVGDYYESLEGYPLVAELRAARDQCARGPINMAHLLYVLDEAIVALDASERLKQAEGKQA